MAKTITALYDDFETAQRAVRDLTESGFDRKRISVIANDSSGEYGSRIEKHEHHDNDDVSAGEGAAFGAVTGAIVGLGTLLIPGIGPVVAAGPIVSALVGAGTGAVAGGAVGGITAGLVDMGVDEDTAHTYAEGVRRGGVLVIAHTRDDRSDNALRTLERYNPIDIDTRSTEWRKEGWNRFDERSEPYTRQQVEAERTRYRSESPNTMREEVVEEDLKVGKREVESGGVRVRSYVTEKPVEEEIRLRDEHVEVNRRQVDRPATESDFATDDETYVMHERHEEGVVSKEARVVEEVEVDKDVEEHTETIRETVRRKDVDVERMGTEAEGEYANYEPAFQAHCKNTYGEGNYAKYQPAYRYGYKLALSDRYQNYDWRRVEPEARQTWERQNAGTWDQVNDAVHSAWDKVRHDS